MNENYRKSKQSSKHGNWVTTFLLFISFSLPLSPTFLINDSRWARCATMSAAIWNCWHTINYSWQHKHCAKPERERAPRENFYVIAVCHRKGEDSIFSMLRCETHTGSSSETLTLTHIAHIFPRSPQLTTRFTMSARTPASESMPESKQASASESAVMFKVWPTKRHPIWIMDMVGYAIMKNVWMWFLFAYCLGEMNKRSFWFR